MLKKILYFFAILLTQPAYSQSAAGNSQKPSTIELTNADVFEYRELDGRKLRMLLGNVSFKHEGVLMLCDSAYLYSETNTLDAFGNVHIKEGDSLNIYGDSLQYNGNSRMANIKGRVILLQNNIKLTTGALSHDMPMNTASYYNWGKIIDGENNLTSKIGIFQVNNNELTFRNSVVLINPAYSIYADTMRYNTVTETAFFHGPTEIISEENNISCSLGWYDTKNNICQFTNKAKLFSKDQSVEGDSLFYDRNTGAGKALNNITLFDSIQNIMITGNYAEYFEKEEAAMVTGNAMLTDIYEYDSLFLHADTLRSGHDSAGEFRVFYAYNKVRFYRHDLQGKCDSLIFTYSDSTMQMYVEPVLWSEENQMSADYIELKKNEDGIESISFIDNSFITSQVDSAQYNQIRGKMMKGYFKENILSTIHVSGNGQSIYYPKEEDGTFIGVNRVSCSDMMIYVEENAIKKISFLQQPEATLFPIGDLKPNELMLKGFTWLKEIRPMRKEDVFVWW